MAMRTLSAALCSAVEAALLPEEAALSAEEAGALEQAARERVRAAAVSMAMVFFITELPFCVGRGGLARGLRTLSVRRHRSFNRIVICLPFFLGTAVPGGAAFRCCSGAGNKKTAPAQ